MQLRNMQDVLERIQVQMHSQRSSSIESTKGLRSMDRK